MQLRYHVTGLKAVDYICPSNARLTSEPVPTQAALKQMGIP